MHCSIQTTEFLFEIAEDLLRICKAQNERLAQIDAVNEAETQALIDTEKRLAKLQGE